jgi:hypothetical protein
LDVGLQARKVKAWAEAQERPPTDKIFRPDRPVQITTSWLSSKTLILLAPGAAAEQFSAHEPQTNSNMTPMQSAVLLFRFFSLFLCFDIVVVLTELPPNIYGIFNSPTDYTTRQRELLLALELVRLAFYTGSAMVFLVFARPLAKFMTKGLGHVKDDDVA